MKDRVRGLADVLPWVLTGPPVMIHKELGQKLVAGPPLVIHDFAGTVRRGSETCRNGAATAARGAGRSGGARQLAPPLSSERPAAHPEVDGTTLRAVA